MSDQLANKTYEFTGISPDLFARECADIEKKTGIKITQDEGQASAKGITIGWKYDRAKQTLDIQLLKRSWFDPSEDQISVMLHNEINGVK